MNPVEALNFFINLEEAVVLFMPSYIRHGDFENELKWRRLISRIALRAGYSKEIIRDRKSLHRFVQLVIDTTDNLLQQGILVL
jgi:hypothetical protein